MDNLNYNRNSNNYGQRNSIPNTSFNIHFNENNEIVGNNKNYVDLASDVIGTIDLKKFKTSKIRNILAMVSEIYKTVMVQNSNQLDNDILSKLQYFRIRCLYEAGREKVVKDFIINSNVVNLIKEIGNNKKRFINYYHYFEALVSWHRFNGGEE